MNSCYRVKTSAGRSASTGTTERSPSKEDASKKKDVIPNEVTEEAEKIRRAIEDTRKGVKNAGQKSPASERASERGAPIAAANDTPPKEKVIPASSRSSRKYRQRSSSNSSSGSEGWSKCYILSLGSGK